MKKYKHISANDGKQPSEDRLRVAAGIVARLKSDGVAATVVLPGRLEDFIRGQAEQLLEAARQCEDPELRVKMIDMARNALATLSKPKGEPEAP